jgi:hypothetical protein
MADPDGLACDWAVLSDRACLIAFAAMVLCCDRGVWEQEMGYPAGGGVHFITATGVARRTGLPVTDSERALRRLELAGLAVCGSEGGAWRPGSGVPGG